MKLKSTFLLIAVAWSLVLPLHISVPASGHTTQSLCTLDVCHSGDGALSVNADMPVVHECPCRHLVIEAKIAFEPFENPLVPTGIPFRKEQPPRA